MVPIQQESTRQVRTLVSTLWYLVTNVGVDPRCWRPTNLRCGCAEGTTMDIHHFRHDRQGRTLRYGDSCCTATHRVTTLPQIWFIGVSILISPPRYNHMQPATITISNSDELPLHKTSSFATVSEASSSADRTLGHQLLNCTFDSLQSLIYGLFGSCRRQHSTKVRHIVNTAVTKRLLKAQHSALRHTPEFLW